MIQLNNVTVSYFNHIALHRINLCIEKGVHLAVIGPNGAGKTTFLTAINRLGKIIEGTVTINKEEITSRNIRKFRIKTGYVPQSLNIDARSPVNVFDVVMMGRVGRIGLLRQPTKKDKEIIRNSLHLCGIENLKFRPIGQLSGGERQKVFIARAMAKDPEILLLDEPTASLDIKAQKEITELIDRIYIEKKLTIIFVTHILGNIPFTCNMGCLIKDGKILFSGRIDDALQPEKLETLYECEIKKGEQLTYVRNTSI